MNHTYEILADAIGCEHIDGVHIAGFGNHEAGQYVMLQRHDDENEISIEFDDQINGQVGVIKAISLHGRKLEIDLSELLNGKNHFVIHLDCDDDEYVSIKSKLAEITRGSGSKDLQFECGPD